MMSAVPRNMVDYYYHYTSRYQAQGILAAGRIRPGKSGLIFLTDRLYNNGAEASDMLGIGHKPVEVCFAILESHVSDPIGPDPAASWDNERMGGGPEYTTDQEIDASDASVILMRWP